MPFTINDLDAIIGYDPNTHSVAGLPTLGPKATPADLPSMDAIRRSAAGEQARLTSPFTEEQAKFKLPATEVKPDIPSASASGYGRRLPSDSTSALSANRIPAAPSNANAINNLLSRSQEKGGVGRRMYQAELPSADPSSPDYLHQLDVQQQFKAQHPLGAPVSEKPGFWGKLEHGLAKAGNIAGDVLAPGVMMNIPGTEMNKNAQAWKRLQAEGEQTRQGLEQAQAEEAKGRAWTAMHPGEAETARSQAEFKVKDQFAQQGGFKPGSPQYNKIVFGLEPQSAESQAFNSELAKDPSNPLAAYQAVTPGFNKPPTAEASQRELADLLTKQKAGPLNASDQNRLNVLQQEQAIARPNDAPLSAQEIKDQNAKIDRALAGSGVDPAPFHADDKTLRGAANENLKDAEKAAADARAEKNAARIANAPNEAEQRKDERTQVYAIDPKDNQLKLMSRAEAMRNGQTYDEVSKSIIDGDKKSIRQLNDIQTNVSEYQNAINAIKGNISGTDAAALRRIEAGINDSDVEKMGYMTMGAAMNSLEHGEVSNAWNRLQKDNPDLAKLAIGYLRTKGAMIAYNKVVSGSARSNKEALEVEWANLPTPDVGAAVGNEQMKAVQTNLDQVSQGFPTNIPGMTLPGARRQQIEGAGNAPRVIDLTK